ncbi:unnamed protein product [Durusdinium trenchii]|uniref:Uncharacterized protein n=1 Tax=Durusdinium trenchii TaxID=1381693 RepID=A0ABP0LU72_9DINO
MLRRNSNNHCKFPCRHLFGSNQQCAGLAFRLQGSASHAILLFPMPLTSSQASKILYNALQAAILFGFVGFVFTSILRPEAGRISSSKLTEEKHHCVSSKTWMILPFAFLTGGLINIDGFASTAVLLL